MELIRKANQMLDWLSKTYKISVYVCVYTYDYIFLYRVPS